MIEYDFEKLIIITIFLATVANAWASLFHFRRTIGMGCVTNRYYRVFPNYAFFDLLLPDFAHCLHVFCTI